MSWSASTDRNVLTGFQLGLYFQSVVISLGGPPGWNPTIAERQGRKQRWLLTCASLLVDGNVSTLAAGNSLMLQPHSFIHFLVLIPTALMGTCRRSQWLDGIITISVFHRHLLHHPESKISFSFDLSKAKFYVSSIWVQALVWEEFKVM